jgi:predicted RNA polymerase sigma factor
MTDNPIVALNRAVAVAMFEGPSAGLATLEGLERLAGHHRLDAVRGHLLEVNGHHDAAPAQSPKSRARRGCGPSA